MIFQHKNRFKPLYKQFINLRENVQNQKKILNFKRQKWNLLINFTKRKLKRFRKFKPQDQMQYVVSRYPNRGTSYKKNKHRNTIQTYKKFKLFYGNFTRKKMKKFIKKSLNTKNRNIYLTFLKLFESRLDTVLYRAKFSTSLRSARQLIVHKKVSVNKQKVKNQAFVLNPGDLISIDLKHNTLVEKGIARSNNWPIPPKHLTINYKTLQIIFGNIGHINISTFYHFNLKLEKLLVDYLQH